MGSDLEVSDLASLASERRDQRIEARAVRLVLTGGYQQTRNVHSALASASNYKRPEAQRSPHSELEIIKTTKQTLQAGQVFWYEQITHDGMSPFITGGEKWKIFRNIVAEYGADDSGKVDAAPALQKAVNDGSRNTNMFGTTGQPAVVYIPKGVYVLDSPLQLFIGNTLIYAKDPHADSTLNFYIALKNLQLDSTSIGKDSNFTLLDWSVSQGTQLTNILFNMPTSSTGHTGIAMPAGGSGTHMSDLTFKGGAVGINVSNQQYEIASTTFTGCTTGILVTSCFSCVFVGLDFQNSAVGIDMSSNNAHSVTLLDSTASNMGTIIKTQASSTGDHSLVIENLSAQAGCSSVVSADSTKLLTESVTGTWDGNTYTSKGPQTGSHQNGTMYASPRSSLLTSNGRYPHVPAPIYQDNSLTQFLNVKNVPSLPVHGDGKHDDTANLNAIIAKYAQSKILFFPHGTYLISSTLHFPPGSRIVGEAWSTVSASGPYFKNVNQPQPLVRVGFPAEKGLAQFTDMLFTVSDILPGCILLEVNMAGLHPGDVGFWNTHIRIGGAADSAVRTKCASPEASSCRAAFLLVHLTASSSTYIENMWAWTADHDLDDSGRNAKQSISTGRGMLIEATAGTWLHGTAVEHNTLYQYNFHTARNVFVGLQQSETPYWQGSSSLLAPAPWIPSLAYGDPDFSNCGGADERCRMAWYNHIRDSSEVSIYGSAFWTFFDGGDGSCQQQGFCQKNACWVEGSEDFKWYNLNTHGVRDLVVGEGDQRNVSAFFNPGSWGAVVAAYLS
ncbi:MAG: hypothetical protein Q9195_007814 [Heterodermia aff. obscurata]